MFVARWDLDKTYLRTEFDSLGALVRTAVQRPDHKRAVPGAAELMRGLGDAGAEIHILSGSPEQLRSRIVQKLRLDGVAFASLTLKPNLQNLLRLRFRALRGQLGYKLPALLRRRCELRRQRDADGALVGEILLGDDAEADALVYSLYADVCADRVSRTELAAILHAAGAYRDEVADALRFASFVQRGPVVERILIHLDRQSSPASFEAYGARVVPFYNYLQAAFVLLEAGRLSAEATLGVARELVVRHHFDGVSLGRGYQQLLRRGDARGAAAGPLRAALEAIPSRRALSGAAELAAMVRAVEAASLDLPAAARPVEPWLDYLQLAGRLGRARPRRC
jgi:hypothetical protein